MPPRERHTTNMDFNEDDLLAETNKEEEEPEKKPERRTVFQKRRARQFTMPRITVYDDEGNLKEMPIMVP